jgi:hypothetical protein
VIISQFHHITENREHYGGLSQQRIKSAVPKADSRGRKRLNSKGIL